MPRMSAAGTLVKDLQPAQLLKRYHRRTRRRVPCLQTLALLLPLLSLISRVRISGRENIPDGGYIAAANHRSNLDALFVTLALRRRIRFMGKSELFDGRWGWLLNRLGAFPVQRGVWDAEAFETAATVLKRGRVMSIFPEGGVHVERVRRSRASVTSRISRGRWSCRCTSTARARCTRRGAGRRCGSLSARRCTSRRTRSLRASSPSRRRSASSTRSTTSLNRGPAHRGGHGRRMRPSRVS
jgi:1-acyl-sn-glycerol-3-phosphate acyltransferase